MSVSKNKGRRKVSLFTRYIIIFFSAEIISLVAFGIVFSFFITGTWENKQKQELYNQTLNIAQVYQEYINAEASQVNEIASRLNYVIESSKDSSRADIYITDVTGTVIFCSHMVESDHIKSVKTDCDEHSGIQVPGEITTGILADGILATSGNLGGLYDEECFISASVARKSNEHNADAIVFAVQSYDEGLEPYRSTFIQIYVAAAIGFIAITGFVVYVLTYNLVKIIRDMSTATKKYSKGDFSYRIKMQKRSSVREFDELSAEINSMAENLERLEQSRSEFVANVSHELKTPMTTIGGFIDGILDGTIDGEQQKHYLKIVSDEVKRLSRLVGSMLNMSKMEAGELRINPEKYNLTRQIIGIFMSFEQKIENKGINIKGLDDLTNHYIEADPDMLNQVFYNLIDNAIKFTLNNGEISASMNSDGEYVTVVIRNTGKGITDEDIDHIFERFYKVDKSRSLDTKSVGLGLFIVKKIVNLHNGEISVNSKYGHYTEFAVKLRINLSVV